MEMKKTIVFLFACACTLFAHGQNEEGTANPNIDWQEDENEIMSIQDVINEQQQVTTHNMTETHLTDVWSRNSFFNLSFCNTKMTPDNALPSGLDDGFVSDFSSKLGFSIQSGRSYRLHLVPIANTVQFHLDYTWIDLAASYFDKNCVGDFAYDSSKKKGGDSKYYMPWNLKKYEASYGMSLGPSVTVCPFNYLESQGLHFFKVNLYYHIGYQVSAIFISGDDSLDKNQVKGTSDDGKRHKQLNDNMKGEWGHGLMNSFGFSITWKSIGLGYEHSSSKLNYKPFSTSDFGSDKDKITVSRNRMFIQFRM